MMPRKVCIVTGTRAEWGLLSTIARELQLRDDVELQIVATNTHLSHRYGHTIDEIIRDGFTVDATVDIIDDCAPDTTLLVAQSMARCLDGMAQTFDTLKPDLVVILGDRSEMLAVASAATVMRIPIVHLHGGEITRGAIDDALRHAITKMASLHLVSTEEYRHRVIQMGENPDMVINTGAIGVTNALSAPMASDAELISAIGFLPDKHTLLVTYHPATLDTESASDRMNELLHALDRFPDYKIIFTHPNNDAQGSVIRKLIDEYAALYPHRVKAVTSLGMVRYMTTIRKVAAVVGNSSSGIIEVPSVGTPTVNIGIRQLGRTAAASVIHCGDSADEIAGAIHKALSGEYQAIAISCTNPYYRPDTLRLITEAIATTPIESLTHKQFYDL